MDRPRYFVAVFGDPRPDKDAVDSGVYTPDSKYAPFPTRPGDVMLLYCTTGYAAYSMQVPGIGVVLRVDRNNIGYRWLPFTQPIPKATIDVSFDPDDLVNMGNIRFSAKWLFEVSQKSFLKTISDRAIAWGNL
jgi:hypothetical protein